MSILDALHQGSLGFRIALPEHATVTQQWDHAAELQDDVRSVLWRLATSPARFVVEGADDELQGDLARDCRAAFEAEFSARYASLSMSQRPLVRTDDINFSPLIAARPFQLAGGDPAIAVTHYVAFEQGHEVTSARLFVPTRDGTCEVSTWAADAPDGWRNSISSLCQLRPGPPVQMRLGSRRSADRRHHPKSALERCRSAMSYAFNELAPLVTREVPKRSTRRVSAPGVGGSFELPPRYEAAPTLGLSDITSEMTFGRVALLEFPRWLRVKRELDVRISSLFTGQKRKKLERIAEQRLNEPAGDERILEVRLRDAPSAPSLPAIDTYVRLRTATDLRHRAGRWWVTPGGEVVHIHIEAPSFVPSTELREQLSVAATSWRALPGR